MAGGRHLDLVLVYRPSKTYNAESDNCDVKTNNERLANLFSKVQKPSVILGDFNCSDIDWSNSTTTRSSFLLQATTDNGFQQHIEFPTHRSGTTPDLVFSSQSSLVMDVAELAHLGKSDHSMIMVTIAGRLARPPPTNEQVPDWKNADLDGMRQELSEKDWNDLEALGCEQSWKAFRDVLDNIQLKYVPTKLRRVQGKPNWMNNSVMRTIRKKRRLWKHYTTTKDHSDYIAYKAVEREAIKSVRKAKKNYERKLSQEAKSNPKAFYAYLKSKTSNRETVGPLASGTGPNAESVSDDGKMATMLNQFFSSVFTDEDLQSLPQPTQSFQGADPLEDLLITPEKVRLKLDAMRSTAAPGPDGLRPCFLKQFSTSLAIPLAIIFKQSLVEGVVPEDWRCANVTPIYKKGGKSQVGNYRPVSLTSVLCKVMESMIKDALMNHLMTNCLLNASQHGFMKRKSCLTNLVDYLDKLTKLIDDGHNVDVLYLDFSKAFDKVPHARLMAKLDAMGVRGNVHRWIREWLHDRKQRVVLNGQFSEWLPVLSGVPQGSVLGPALFLVYINDIDGAVDGLTYISKFADDSKVMRCVDCDADREAMQSNINSLIEWSDKWQMSFNAIKCKVIHFGRNNPRHSYHMGGFAPGGTVLEAVEKEKDVGVIIHQSLKPSTQCAKAAAKGKQVLGQMARSVTLRDRHTWPRLYCTYVRPHLEYAVQAWNPWLDCDIAALESVQQQALKYVSGTAGMSYEQRLDYVNLTTLEARRHRGDLIQTWKYLHCKQDVDPLSLFVMSNQAISRPTRSNSKPLSLKEQNCKYDVRRYAFPVRVVRPWNDLPAHIQTATSVNSFKNAYDEHIANRIRA